jgi:hypothetical protein
MPPIACARHFQVIGSIAGAECGSDDAAIAAKFLFFAQKQKNLFHF